MAIKAERETTAKIKWLESKKPEIFCGSEVFINKENAAGKGWKVSFEKRILKFEDNFLRQKKSIIVFG